MTALAPTAVPQEGYKFDKWNSDLKKAFEGDTAITAEYEALASEEVTVTYEADGKILSTEVVKKGEKPKAVPADPMKSGYTFEGWQKNGAGEDYSRADIEAMSINEAVKFVEIGRAHV